MRKCEDCRIILDDQVRFCPSCGKRVDSAEPADPEGRVGLAALLTSANLHRVRQEWDAAIADATEALRLAPGDPEVASLLASIYEQRGNLDEAAVWYKIALDIDPRNAANQARLQRVSEAIVSMAREGSSHRTNSDNRTWMLVAAGIVIVALVVALFALALRGPRREPSRPAVSVERPSGPAPIRQPASTPGSRTTRTSPQASVTEAEGRQTGSSLRTAAEDAIRTAAGGAQAVQGSGARVDDVIADPRSGTVVATFSMPATGALTRDNIMAAAFAVSRAAFAHNPAVQSVTARCVVSTGRPGAQIAFVGDIARAAFEALGENPAPQSIQSAFTNGWWNPQIGGG